MIQRQW